MTTAPPPGDDELDPFGPGPGPEELATYETTPPSQPSAGPLPGRHAAEPDVQRAQPVVVHGDGLGPSQVVERLRTARQADPDRPALAIRLSEEALAGVAAEFPSVEVDSVARACVLGVLPAPQGQVCVVSERPDDAAVVAEVALAVRVFGSHVRHTQGEDDAGPARFPADRAALDEADCLVVVAGADPTLASRVASQTGAPVVAVPTSAGSPAPFGGLPALLGMLGSTAPGIAVCTIDNGCGAGAFAARVARRAQSRS